MALAAAPKNTRLGLAVLVLGLLFAFCCMYWSLVGDYPRFLIGAPPAASSLVWSKRDDGSSTLIGVPLNVDGTRCEAPRDAEGFSDAFCRCAAVAALGHTIWMGLILKELLGYNST